MGIDGPMTPEACLTACVDHGYPLAGLEFADECCMLYIILPFRCA